MAIFTSNMSPAFILKLLAWPLLPVSTPRLPSDVFVLTNDQYLLIRIIYNVFFHPLKHYPGPRIMAASRIPIFCLVLTGRSATWLTRLHAAYGPVVRVAPNELSYSSARAWKDIHSSTSAHPVGLPRDMAFFKALGDEKGAPTILSADNQDHARMRRVYARAFSKQALAAQEPIMLQYASMLIRKLCEESKQTAKPVDISKFLHLTLFDMMTDLQFGESFRLLDDPTYQAFARASLVIIPGATILSALVDFPLVRITLQPIVRRLLKIRHNYFTVTNERLDKRLASKAYRPDLVQFLTEARADSLSTAELRANAPLISLAGSETTTVAINGMIAHLLLTPHILTQLQQEVRTKFRSSSDITMKAMAGMPVLEACIKEALRVYPAIPIMPARVVPSSGANIAGQWVAGGTRVYITSLAAFHSADNFHNPEAFAPERWYKTTESEAAFKDDEDAYKPFSIGPYNCVGQHMAPYLMSLMICHLALHFDFEVSTDPRTWLSTQRSWIVCYNPALTVKLTPTKAVDCLTLGEGIR
ncbi:cytochrome P450 [Aspergillus ibericus CBS 121593]|uniref:Cytochrome P450 n=1 Tax=Aspergillus ibericus CBS 121593 TaxID=1448316 RepID=A0A395GZI9_9EURO|nr:cytochrome P450 [Aspergillus ibericus CBS 121593]RAL00780.1 cytochrome P450 [Aspergillus ibericus CBS 121593]